ncbi:MAG: CotH kinase family protein [Acidimicrobiales bacterium]
MAAPHAPHSSTGNRFSLDRSTAGRLRRFIRNSAVGGVVAVVMLSSCSTADDETLAAASGGLGSDGQITASQASVDTDTDTDTGSGALFDSSIVHTIEIDFDQDEYVEMIDTFVNTGEKDWIAATVVVDGVSYENAGVRLKGNSSLFELTQETAENPEDLPWLIRLDKYVDDQNHQGYNDIVIRSTSTETALNEAVALELLDATGLAAEQAIATTFTVNGGETELRLAIEHPDDGWEEANFDSADGLLYKADSEGDYSYRGDDPEAYEDVFDQKAGEDDLEPLTEFLDFINNVDDQTFVAELHSHLDVDAFATYLAFQDLIGNADDINGRGNNSYLHYAPETELFTVVSWDLNLAFDTANVGGGGGGGNGGRPDGGDRPARPDGAAGPAAGIGGGGPGDQSNVLVDRFMADDDFAALYASKTAELTDLLYSSGLVDQVIETWTDVLGAGASDLVTDEIITAEAAAITAYVDGAR